jgi:hypothetical protein
MMVSDKKEGGAQAAAAGLFCSVGRDVFCRDGGRELWQIVLPHDFDAFDHDPLAHPQPSPDGQHGAHVGISGAERYVCMVALPGPVARTFPTVLSRVAGMAWSPAGKRLCVVAGDPSVGVLSMDRSRPSTALPVFSLFLAGKDDPDLTPVTGPIALPGIPRWSPAGDAVAVVGLERGSSQVALVVTTDGREGPLVSGERVMLGTVAWTGSGSLLCAVSERGGGVHVQLVDTATGASTEQGEPWEDVCWLSLVGKRVLVAGKSGGAWCVADVTGGIRTVLTASFASITDVAATAEHLWVVAAVESGELGLWSMDLRGEHLHLRIVAQSIRGMQMRLDGRTVAVMAGPAGTETVRVVTIDDEEVLDIGRRDMIMGWIEEHVPHGRLPRLHYLLTPMFQPIDTPVMPSPPGDAETGTLELPDAPEALAPSAPVVPEEEGNESTVSDDAAGQTVSAHGALMTALLRRLSQRPDGRSRWLRLVVVLVVIVVVGIVGVVMAVQHGKQADVAAEGTPSVSTPSTPSVSLPGDHVAGTPSAVTVTPKVSSPAAAKPPSTTRPVIVTYGVRTGIWVACTERLRVRSAAGTGNTIIGYLLVTERARVLSGPTLVGTIPWWHVRCYDTDGKARRTGWVSGEYVRPSSAPVVSPLAAPAASPQPPSAVKPVPVIKPFVVKPLTTGTLVLTTVPSGASVAVNGTNMGVTPLPMMLPDKETSITVSLAEYMDYTTTVTLKAGTTIHVTWLLLPLGFPLGSAAH